MNMSVLCQIQHVVGTALTYHYKAVNDLSGVAGDLFCFKLCLREDIRD